VQRSAEARQRAKLALELRCGPRERLFDPEEAGDRSSAVASFGHRPGDHDLVADVLIDLASVKAGFQRRLEAAAIDVPVI
jgi:hypothetical protein